MSEYVLVNKNTVVFEPTSVLCRAEDRLRLLIIVHSAPGNIEARDTIRQTWAKAAKEELPGIRVIFQLGRVSSSIKEKGMMEEAIGAEYGLHGDVLQQVFI